MRRSPRYERARAALGWCEPRSGTDDPGPEYTPPRERGVRYARVDPSRISSRLGYAPSPHAAEGLREARWWYAEAPEHAALEAAPNP